MIIDLRLQSFWACVCLTTFITAGSTPIFPTPSKGIISGIEIAQEMRNHRPEKPCQSWLLWSTKFFLNSKNSTWSGKMACCERTAGWARQPYTALPAGSYTPSQAWTKNKAIKIRYRMKLYEYSNEPQFWRISDIFHPSIQTNLFRWMPLLISNAFINPETPSLIMIWSFLLWEPISNE